MKLRQSAIAVTLLLTAASSAHALEPLVPPGNFEGVCRRIPKIKEMSETIITASPVAENARELFAEFQGLLTSLAFGAETRLTVDANDIEGPLGAAEFFFYYVGDLSREERTLDLRYSVTVLSARYGCEEWKWRSEIE